MKVVKIKTNDGKERYYVADNNGIPIESVLKFIKFKDNVNYARNTLKQYCQGLKLYFEYLEFIKKDFKDITIDDLSLFVNWLQKPNINNKIIPFNQVKNIRCAKTINTVIDTVLAYYDYLLRHEEYSNDISEKVKKFLCQPTKNFKGFLYGIAYEKRKISSNILKLKLPKAKPKVLTKENVSTLINSCTNNRDEFLLSLLYETGMRIGEVLSLWLEDIDISNKTIDIKDRGNLENNAEIKTVSSPRIINISQNIVDMFMEYINIYHNEEVKTNHIFIKILGKNQNKAMEYIDVDNLFRTLKNKTNIYVTAHMFRHTSLTMLRMAGWKPELLKIRAGHKNIYTTLNTYIHPSDEDVSKAFNATKAAISLDKEVVKI